MNALIGLEDKSQLVLSSSGIGLPQPGQQPRGPGPALLRGHPLRGNLFDAVLHRLRIPSQRDHRFHKRVFDLVKDFGTSESPKSTRSSTTHWCPGRPGHPAFRHNIASSLRLHTGLPYDWTPRSDAPLGSPLAPSARRVSRVASRLPGTTRLRFAHSGGAVIPSY